MSNKTKAGPIAADRLKSFIERIEKMESERKAVGEDIRDIYSEAKGVGYDVKTMRKIVQLRAQNAADRDEAEALLDVYRHALGMEAGIGHNSPREPTEDELMAQAGSVLKEVDLCAKYLVGMDGTPPKIQAIKDYVGCSTGKAHKLRALVIERLEGFSPSNVETVKTGNENLPPLDEPLEREAQEETDDGEAVSGVGREPRPFDRDISDEGRHRVISEHDADLGAGSGGVHLAAADSERAAAQDSASESSGAPGHGEQAPLTDEAGAVGSLQGETTLCGCETCVEERLNDEVAAGQIGPNHKGWRYACEICGNKRCPHHTDHRLACTNSNEPGQPGSSWEHLPASTEIGAVVEASAPERVASIQEREGVGCGPGSEPAPLGGLRIGGDAPLHPLSPSAFSDRPACPSTPPQQGDSISVPQRRDNYGKATSQREDSRIHRGGVHQVNDEGFPSGTPDRREAFEASRGALHLERAPSLDPVQAPSGDHCLLCDSRDAVPECTADKRNQNLHSLPSLKRFDENDRPFSQFDTQNTVASNTSTPQPLSHSTGDDGLEIPARLRRVRV